MKLIPLTRGFFAKVDDSDFDVLNKVKWRVHQRRRTKTNYAAHSARDPVSKKQITILMHRLILRSPLTDHRDGDGLNNQRHNLRRASWSQNSANRGILRNNRVGFKGVCRKRNKFQATIRSNRKQIYLGLFPTPESAALAYNKKAIEIFGEFAKLNTL